MKKGQKVVFNFHGFGQVSKEEAIVIDVKDDVITIDKGNYKFSLSDGSCINDNTSMGCSRSLCNDYLKS